MIKLRRLPRGGIVTCVASLRKSLRNVVWIRRALEIFEVAGNASVGCQIEVVVGMAVGTNPRWHRVHAGQREVDAIVVESRRRPACCGVAGIAGG